MKSRLLLSWTCCALLTLSAAQAADKKAVVDDNLIGLKTANGKLVYRFVNMWWNEKKGEEAWDALVSHDNYLNHAVYSAKRGQQLSFEEEKQSEIKVAANSTTRFEVRQLISQGSLVFAHVHAVKPNGPGSELVMIFRVRNGKITDHWDIHEALNEDSVVFDNLVR
jgi:predicted SnoaL-like aldol condensation-catalyzing enzyme